MQTLKFNKTTKEVKLCDGYHNDSKLIFHFKNTPTVKVKEEGFYEVMVKESDEKNVPVARFPIANTIMLIEK